MYDPESGGGSFRMTIRCSKLMLVFKDSGRSDFGSADIWVDGLRVRTADPHENNWTHCNATLLLNESDCKEHAVEIRMADGHEDKRFTILGFAHS